MTSYSLYVHMPFCQKKCDYCDFTSYAGLEAMMPPYLAALRNELATYAKVLESKNIRTVYFGGGTPSTVPENEIAGLLDSIRNDFILEEKAEVSIEVNPGTVNLAKLQVYKKAGMNRISIGAQSFNEKELKALGRIHTASQITYTFQSAVNAGFDNINLDLMFALPDQDLASWGNNLKQAVALGPKHISTYNLVIEEGTPFHKRKSELLLPNDEIEALMYEDAINGLVSCGYDHYEISNFAKPGFECRNNLTYWNNDEYIGVGAGATSYIAGSRFSNPTSLEEYISIWTSINPLIIKENYERNKQDRERQFQETIFLGLRLISGLDLYALIDKFGKEMMLKYGKVLGELEGDGLLTMSDSKLKLTKRGLFIANEVFEKFV